MKAMELCRNVLNAADIAQLLGEEALGQMELLRGRCRRIVQPGDIKQALMSELKGCFVGLSIQGLLTLFVITAFVFALIVTVI